MNFFFSREIVEDDSFLNLPYDKLVELISSNELNDSSEEIVRNFSFFIDKI